MMNEKVKQFLKTTQEEMSAAGVRMLMEKDKSHVLADGIECNGYFDDSPLEFAVGMDKPFGQWFSVYVHEYCHFTQLRDKSSVWAASHVKGDEKFWEMWFDKKQPYPQEVIDRYVLPLLEVEADCERRALKIHRENPEFGIDPDVYAQKANSYIHFYNYVRLFRKWYTPHKEPYNIKEVWTQFNIDIDDDFEVSYEYIDLYKKYCID